MQLSGVRIVSEFDGSADVAGHRATDETPLSPRVCLAIWALIAGCGWGAIGVVAAIVT